MAKDDLERRCKRAIFSIASDVKDINYKLTHFIENYREDYYKARNGISYLKDSEYH